MHMHMRTHQIESYRNSLAVLVRIGDQVRERWLVDERWRYLKSSENRCILFGSIRRDLVRFGVTT